MNHLIFLFVFFFSGTVCCNAMSDSLFHFKVEATIIDSSHLNLEVIPYELLEETLPHYDHGVEMKLYCDTAGLKKAEISYGLSRGPIIISIYFKNNVPFYIREVTKHYYFDRKTGRHNYYEPLSQIAEKELYTFNWIKKKSVNWYNGKEQLFESKMHQFSVLDYVFEVDLAKQYFTHN